mmetsp:Transcript_14844/g.33790  ORF Transcript_14844/g.33790 Transcript_14844/m.33790 type:complete len:239 (-) Transcript_14844:2231-2947(-)
MQQSVIDGFPRGLPSLLTYSCNNSVHVIVMSLQQILASSSVIEAHLCQPFQLLLKLLVLAVADSISIARNSTEHWFEKVFHQGPLRGPLLLWLPSRIDTRLCFWCHATCLSDFSFNHPCCCPLIKPIPNCPASGPASDKLLLSLRDDSRLVEVVANLVVLCTCPAFDFRSSLIWLLLLLLSLGLLLPTARIHPRLGSHVLGEVRTKHPPINLRGTRRRLGDFLQELLCLNQCQRVIHG